MSDKTQSIKTKTSETFYSAFIGELVEVITQFKLGEAEAVGTLSAYLLDVDEDYYYLGETGEEVSTAIKRTSVYSIRIIKSSTWKEKLLNEMEVPMDEEGFN